MGQCDLNHTHVHVGDYLGMDQFLLELFGLPTIGVVVP